MANPKMTKQWFTYAARDLKAAKLMMAHGAQFKNEIAFHIQQSIEKAEAINPSLSCSDLSSLQLEELADNLTERPIMNSIRNIFI